MAESKYDVRKFPDPSIIYVDMRSTDFTATVGDWMAVNSGSAQALDNGNDDYIRSGLGIAMMNHPSWNSHGVPVVNDQFPIATDGVFHVKISGAAVLGRYYMPASVGSGIVGQTGLTGEPAFWSVTTNANADNSGVARLTRVLDNGEAEIQLVPPVVRPII